MERREFARIHVNLLLKFKGLESLEGLMAGAAQDLSLGGIFIRTPEARKVGSSVQMEIPFRDSEKIIIRGLVRSIRYERNQPIGMGIEFVDLDDSARALIQYLINKQRSDKLPPTRGRK